MPENEFEKHVQAKMNELRLRPSGAVWNAVEEQIRKKRKRRTVFFILLLAGLGLAGYSGYLLLDRPGAEPVQAKTITPAGASQHEQNKQPSLPATAISSGNAKQELPQQAAAIPASASSRNSNTVDKDLAASAVAGKTHIAITAIGKTNEEKGKAASQQELEDRIIADRLDSPQPKEWKQKKEMTDKSDASQPVMPEAKDSILLDVVKNEELPEAEAISPGMTGESSTDTTITMAKVAAEELQENVTEVKPVVPQRKSLAKIKLGFEGSSGAVFSRHDAFTVITTERVAADFTSSTPAVTPGSGPAAPPVLPPSSVKAGMGFKAGVFAKMQLSKRSSISAGLRYAYLGEKMKVGSYKDTVFLANGYTQNNLASGIYRGDKQKWRTINYHFIEVPLMYHLELNPGSKLPVSWNAGVSAAYLAGTNALVYDTAAGGVYFKEQGIVSRMHLNFNTGFAFRFGNKGKWQWSIGPEVSMDMTRLMKEDPYTRRRYLLYGGITARLFLPEIKK